MKGGCGSFRSWVVGCDEVAREWSWRAKRATGFRCAADDHGKGLSTRILEFHRGTRHTNSTYRPSKTGTRDPQWKQLTHWRFPRPQKVRDNFSYDARAIRDSILRRIVSLRAREPTGVLRGPDAMQSASGRLSTVCRPRLPRR